MTPTLNSLIILTVIYGLLADVSVGGADASGLRSERSLPPAFSLPDRHGHVVRLETFLHSRRIVLLFKPAAAYLDDIAHNRRGFDERELTVLAIVPSNSQIAGKAEETPVTVLIDTHADVARLYGAVPGSPTFYLIGKDGHIAVAQHGYPSPSELFGTVDAMPMRRAEMRERGEK